MNEYAVEANAEMEYRFITSTMPCQLFPESVYVAPDRMHRLRVSSGAEPTSYFKVCDSTAEFYIRLLNTCHALGMLMD